MNAIKLQTQEGKSLMKIESIIKIESRSNYCKLFFDNNKSLVVAKLLSWFENQFNENHFIRPNRSFLINSNFINMINSDTIELNTGEIVKISRRKRAKIHKQNCKFIS